MSTTGQLNLRDNGEGSIFPEGEIDPNWLYTMPGSGNEALGGNDQDDVAGFNNFVQR